MDPAADSPAGTGVSGIVCRPRLLDKLAAPVRVTVVSAPAGSGKTVLLRSWAATASGAAWVSVAREENDAQRFWLSVLDALRRTGAGGKLVQAVTAAPEFDGWAIVERLLADLAPLAEPLWLVIDDVHELASAQALRQLELLIMRAPPLLRFVLATRRDVRLGLHRLRLEGGLAEIRGTELRFTVQEAAGLFEAAGVRLPGLAKLVERTEGWAAGLRLAALSLSGHADPERFAEEFSGSERTVAEYLLAEVLDRQPDQVRRLLLCTCVLESVNGELADLLTGAGGGEQILQDLEQANAFVVSLDARRSWFRYHQLFTDLLNLELRRTAPQQVAVLHRAAAGWLAGHGYPVEAIRQAQAGRDWGLAARLLAEHWPGLHLDGRDAAVHALLADFPAESRAGDAELAALAAADELAYGSVDAADRHLDAADRYLESVPQARRVQARLLAEIVRLLAARQRGDVSALAEAARGLEAAANAHDCAVAELGRELQVLALTGLGGAEVWAGRFQEAERHLEQGVALARRIGRPYPAFTGLVHIAGVCVAQSFPRAAEHARQAIELAERHGWMDEPAAGTAYATLGGVLTWQGRLQEAEHWIRRAERTVRAEAQPIVGIGLCYYRAALEMACGRYRESLTAFAAIERLAALLATPNRRVLAMRAFEMQARVHLGEVERAEQMLAGFDEHDRDLGEVRIGTAMLRLVQNDPRSASRELAPVLDARASLLWRPWLAQAFLLDAIAQDALHDEAATRRSLERALERAEPDGALLWFLLHPVPGLLERHARSGTAHAALVADVLSLLAGRRSEASIASGSRPVLVALSDREIRVLRYLPTHLTAPQIAEELFVSLNTVRTHLRNLYSKLDAHSRAEVVARARGLGLLAPSASLRRQAANLE